MFRETSNNRILMKILILTTGGTIDKIYYDRLSDYQVGAPVVGSILSRIRVAFDYEVIQLFRKDSLDLTGEDRGRVLEMVKSRDETRVLITHGTDGLVETARELEAAKDKTIVLTGALQPAAFSNTDAEFNIGCALGAAQACPSGVYIAMNGRVFPASEVTKNHAEQIFQPTP